MTFVGNVPVETIKLGTTKLHRFPNGHVFWYYIEVKGQNVRIEKSLYRTLKRIVTEEL